MINGNNFINITREKVQKAKESEVSSKEECDCAKSIKENINVDLNSFVYLADGKWIDDWVEFTSGKYLHS